METVRESWTDERLDDRKEGVSDLSSRVDAGFSESRMELRYETAAFCAALIGSIATQL